MKKLSEHWIGEQFAPAIANADTTGLTDKEEIQVNAWESARNGTVIVTTEREEFARCEVTGLYGPVVKVEVWERASIIDSSGISIVHDMDVLD